MCVVISIDGEIIETGKELKALIGVDNIVFRDGATDVDENECLCHINVEETADRAGLKCKPGDWPEWELSH